MLPECACARAVRAIKWVWSRAWPAGQLKDRSATTCQQRRKDVSLSLLPTMQLMASSTPRYGTHAHKSRWKISPWLLTTVSSSLSRSWIAHGRSAKGGVRVCAPRTTRDYIIRVGAAPLITVAGTVLVHGRHEN